VDFNQSRLSKINLERKSSHRKINFARKEQQNKFRTKIKPSQNKFRTKIKQKLIWNEKSSKINLEQKEQQIDNDPFFLGMPPFQIIPMA